MVPSRYPSRWPGGWRTGPAASSCGWLPGPGGQGWREGSAWREIEVELKTGPASLLDEVGDRLRQAGAVPSAAASKLARLLSGAGSPGGPAPAPPGGD